MIINHEQQLLDTIKKTEKVYIYGAGYVGNLLKKRLEYYGIAIKAMCVTKAKDACETEISVVPRKCLIILAVTSIHREEMIENLIKKGFSNYLVISDKLIYTMERIIGRRLKFQTHIVEHCNLKCRGCYHFSPLADEEFLSIDNYERDIARLADLFDYRVEELLLLGGEPLLHPQLTDFLRLSRKYFKEGEIKILTNGLLLLSIKEEFYSALIDYNVQLWVTKYPVAFDYDKAEKRACEFGVKIHYFNPEPVRTLGHQPLDLSGSRNYKINFYGCYRANECIDLKHGRMFPCIIPAEIKAFNRYFHTELVCDNEDYVDIYSVKDAEELLTKLDKPIRFCRYCNRDDVKAYGAIPWELTKKQINEWIE